MFKIQNEYVIIFNINDGFCISSKKFFLDYSECPITNELKFKLFYYFIFQETLCN